METMTCKDALPLVPAYLDGELGEARAGLLRKHLLECQPCRASAQDGKALKRWFTPLAEASGDPRSAEYVAVPNGFAARIARRALAGDTGEREVLIPSMPPRAAAFRSQGDVLPFVLKVTALAAGLLFALAVGMRMQTRPDLNRLSANDRTLVPVERVIEQLDQLNRGDETAESATSEAQRRAEKRESRENEKR
jgi:hypothetical protein